MERFSAHALRAHERAQLLYPRFVGEIADLAERPRRARLGRDGARWGEVTAADWDAAAAEVAGRHGRA